MRTEINSQMKRAVLERDKHRCRYCGKNVMFARFHMDHVYPNSRGGETSIDNLVTACVGCNAKKRAKVGIWPYPIGYFDNSKKTMMPSFPSVISMVAFIVGVTSALTVSDPIILMLIMLICLIACIISISFIAGFKRNKAH